MADDVALETLATPVGRLSFAVTTTGVAAVGWTTPARLATRCGLPTVDDRARTAPVAAQLAAYFRGERTGFDLPLDWRLTSGAARTVLRTLQTTVRYGSAVTYGELAARSGTGVPARGIGAIMGANPMPIVVPCHRVLAHDGLGGFSGGNGRNGLAVKRWLLTLEGVLPMTFDWSPDRLDDQPDDQPDDRRGDQRGD